MRIVQLGGSWGSSLSAISCGELARAFLECVEDIAVATVVQIVRFPPYVDCPGHADYAEVALLAVPGRPHGLHRCSPRQGDRPGAARSGVVPGRAAELHRAGMRHIGHERMLIVETNLMDEPRSAEDLPDPVPAQQVAPVLGVGRIDWVAEPGAPDGCGPRVSCGRAHHVRPCRGERGLRVLQGAASCAGVWVSSSDWVAGKGPALRLGA